jgi:hypothetical protein
MPDLEFNAETPIRQHLLLLLRYSYMMLILDFFFNNERITKT